MFHSRAPRAGTVSGGPQIRGGSRATHFTAAFVATVSLCFASVPQEAGAVSAPDEQGGADVASWLSGNHGLWQWGARTSSDGFVAPDGVIFPVVDGYVEREEWSDAAVYDVTTGNGKDLRLYFKVVPLIGDDGGTTGDCMPFPGNPAYTISCGHYLLVGVASDGLEVIGFHLDEGDDGGFGSGSADGVLTPNQEDYHEVNNGWMLSSGLCYMKFGLSDNCPEPACSPWTGDPCWQCGDDVNPEVGSYCYWSTDPSETVEPVYGDVHDAIDGYFRWDENSENGYWYNMYDGEEAGRDAWGWMGFVGENLRTAEFLLPFDGLDGTGCTNGRCDVSDARFAMDDVLNILIKVDSTFTSYYYPPEADTKDPGTWVTLQIGGTVDTEPTCSSSGGNAGSSALPAAAVLLVWIAGRVRRRGRGR